MSKNTDDLKSSINHFYEIEIYRSFHPAAAEQSVHVHMTYFQ